MAEFLGNCVGVGLRRFACGFGGALDVDTMLVGAGGEDRVEALHPLEASDGIGGDGGVGVADVRRGVGVRDRGGQVVFVHLIYSSGEWKRSGVDTSVDAARTSACAT